MPPHRILFVDDEPSIRLMLPAILENKGFSVKTAATVPEALAIISAEPFDVLISDLNIGEPADGFTVVSAMRRTQPKCVNFILTGYPAFDTALQAIRKHVDDYLVKPADLDKLVSSIEEKVKNPGPRSPVQLKPVSTVLTENIEEITQAVLREMKSSVDLKRVRLSDKQRIDHVPLMIRDIAERVEKRLEISERALQAAAEHGKTRYQQSYSIPMVVEDTRCLDMVIYKVVQENLLAIDVSRLVHDLRIVNDSLQRSLKRSLRAYLDQGKKAA
jgi:ActR/RegA family two-component response regulator